MASCTWPPDGNGERSRRTCRRTERRTTILVCGAMTIRSSDSNRRLLRSCHPSRAQIIKRPRQAKRFVHLPKRPNADRGAHHCLAQPPSKACQGLKIGSSDAKEKQRRLPPVRRIEIFPDLLKITTGVTPSGTNDAVTSRTPMNRFLDAPIAKGNRDKLKRK
jgi:hypothetical protein